jgi:Skp family chaperone for outer membrane proteins
MPLLLTIPQEIRSMDITARTGWLAPLVGAMLWILAAGAVEAQAPLKVGVFDAQRVSEETLAGKRAQTELEELRDQKQAQLKQREDEAARLEEQLTQQKLSLSPEKFNSMQIELRRKALELDNMKELASRELQLELAAAEAQFNEKLGLVIEQFGREEQFTAIFERGALAWYSPTIDVTTALIDMFDRMFPESGE